MQPMNITPKGRELLGFIQEYIGYNGFPPTLHEMARAMGRKQRKAMLSTNAIREGLERLERAGAIRWTRRIARGIQVLNGKTP